MDLIAVLVIVSRHRVGVIFETWLDWFRLARLQFCHTVRRCICTQFCITSNVTGRHRGPKRKLRAGAERHHHTRLLCAVSHMFAYFYVCLPIGRIEVQ